MKTLGCFLALVVLLLAVPAKAQETFRLEWASIDTYIQPVWDSGTGPVTLEPWVAPDGSGTGYRLTGITGPYAGDFYFRCASEQCVIAGNFSVPYDGTMAVQRNYPAQGDAIIQIDVTWAGHHNGQVIGVGVKEVAPIPNTTSPLKVFITQPAASATVKGTAWVVLWVEGTSGASNVFTLSADGKQIGSQTTTTRGPVTIPWVTSPVPNGAHTVTGTVRDATGNTGTTSITVRVNN